MKDQWISVKDAFVVDNENVLCININGIDSDEREPFIAHREEGSWWCQLNPFNFDEYEDVKVTHWMPLPSPPKEQKKGCDNCAYGPSAYTCTGPICGKWSAWQPKPSPQCIEWTKTLICQNLDPAMQGPEAVINNNADGIQLLFEKIKQLEEKE